MTGTRHESQIAVELTSCGSEGVALEIASSVRPRFALTLIGRFLLGLACGKGAGRKPTEHALETRGSLRRDFWNSIGLSQSPA